MSSHSIPSDDRSNNRMFWKHNSLVKNLWERVLADSGTYTYAFGGYTIADAKTVADDCSGYDPRNNLSESETKDKQKDLDKWFELGRTKLKDYMKDQNTKYLGEYFGASFPYYICGIIFFIASMFCFIYLCVWCTCCSWASAKDDAGEIDKRCCASRCCKKTCYWTLIIVPFFVALFAVGWMIEMQKAVESLDKTACGINNIMNDIKNGVNFKSSTGTYAQFSGMKG